MKEIPTAENFLKSSQDPMKDEDRNEVYMTWQVKEAMIEFAKLHVEVALKEASEKGRIQIDKHELSCSVDKKSILNSYSLDNIK